MTVRSNREVRAGEFRCRIGTFPDPFYLTYYGRRVGIGRRPSAFRTLVGYRRFSWYTLACSGMKPIVEALQNGEAVVIDVRSDRSWIMQPL